MEWKEFEGKQVFCSSKQRVYTGKFIKFESPFIIIIDKYGDKVLINESEILKFIEEENIKNHDKNNKNSK